MRVVVAYKWAPNPQEATVGADGRVDWSRTRSRLSEYDAVAAEVGRTLVDGSREGGEVIGVSVGAAEAASSAARKACLPKGMDAAMILADDALTRLGTAATATCLAAMIRRAGARDPVDLVLTGDGSMDVGAKVVPAYLAALLDWPCLVEVTSVTGAPGEWIIERAFGGGTQRLRLAAPAVLSIATDAASPRPVGMKDILAAGRKPVEVVTLDELDAVEPVRQLVRGGPAGGDGDGASAPLDPAVEQISSRPPALRPRKRQRIDGSDPAAAARELVAALRTDGVL